MTRDNSAAVAAICCRVDGLPLAIELAAARIRYFSPAVLLSRLDSRLELLSGGPRDLPERQLTLRNTIAWSYDLLSEDEKRLFRRLSVFVGGCTLDAAEAIGSETGDPERSTLDGVLSLVDWNVLQREQNGEGQLRFSMLETIREFGLECLAASGEEAAVRERHQRLFLALAEQAEPELRGPDQDVWFQRLEKEHDNLRGALDWSLSAGDPDLGLRLGGALGWFWATRGYGYGQEGGRWLTALLARAGPAVRTMGRAKALLAAAGLSQRNTPMAAEALALCRELGHRPGVALALLYLGSAARWRGDWREAEALWEQSLALARDLGDPWLMLRSLDWLGNFIWSQRDPSRAAALFEESVSLSREIGDTRALAIALGSLGELRTDQGNDDRARPLLEESLALAREAGEPFLVTLALYRLGRMAAEHGDVDCAVPLLEESLALARDRKMLGPLAHSLRARAFLAERQGQPAQAAKLYRESLALEQQLGRPEVIPEGLVGLGRAAATQGQAERAARLWGAAEALREQRGIPPPPTRAQDEQCRALAQRTLGEAAFAAAWAAGRAMPLSEAMACVSQRTSGDSPVK